MVSTKALLPPSRHSARKGHKKITKELFCNHVGQDGISQRKTKGGGKLRGGENIPQSPFPKTVLDAPAYDTFASPPFVHALSFSLEETGTDQTNPIFYQKA